MVMVEIIFGFVGLLLFGLLMFWMGYRLGIQHTEARWSDAVAKSIDARRRVVTAFGVWRRNDTSATSSDLWHAIENLKTFG